MIISYKHFVLTGTVDECIDFIQKMTPCAVSSTTNVIIDDDTQENLLNGFKVNKQ